MTPDPAQEPLTLDAYRAGYTGSLSREQIEFYDAEGYLLLPDLLDESDLAPVKAAMNQKVDEIAATLCAQGEIRHKFEDEPFETRLARMFAGKPDETFLQFGRGWRDRLPGYFHLNANPKILDAVESLIGGEIFCNPVYNTRPKVPGVAAGIVPWHQDRSYWPGANANPVITAWVAVVAATPENGCLQIMPRTHRQRLLSHHAESYTGTRYTEIDNQHLRGVERAVTVPVPAGGVVLFNDRCIHRSTANRTDRVRWSVDLRYQPTDQDPMTRHGIGFLARSYKHPERVATLDDWLAGRMERGGPVIAQG